MAETLLLPVLRGVIGKAADVLVQSITRMWGVDNDRRRLERHLVYVSRMLADAEVRGETDPAIRTWMNALKAVAYKADDVLDDFQYEALRREAQGNRSMASKVLSSLTSKNRLVFRYKTSRELKDVLNKIDELVTEMSKFGLVERAEAPQIPYRQTHSAMDDSAEIFGRDEDKEVVVKQLLNHQDQKNVQVLSIIGMGGLGKTTLAKMVYNDSRVQKHFGLKMWHCVSENFDVTPVVRSVIELATKGRCDLPDNVELLRERLQEVIGRKRFLLVLDDVWNEEQHKWEDYLKPLLCSLGGSGSMILVTSRSRRVALTMSTFPPYELVCLSEDDSWELFSKKAFSKGVKEQPEFVVIGRRIAKKCQGLPLALKTMGGLMSSKQQIWEWEAIADCNISDTGRGKDEVMSILKLSYKHLSSEMKQCFAFCAVFPKDCEIDKDMLIQLWMANGYIHEEGMNLAQRAEFVFNELVWRSFLQDGIILPRATRFMYASEQELSGCKMHDLMHDLAKEVGNECATVEGLIQRKVPIHLQISEHDQLKEITPLLRGTINLRTLFTAPSSEKGLVEAKLLSLRALCFICRDSSIALRQLIQTPHLRYLDLSGSSIVSLPDTVCLLYNLLSLRLNYCTELQNLPEGMSCMRKLSYIYLLGCHSLKRMPPKLSLLHNLRILTTFVVSTGNGRGIEELEDLRQLGNRLELYNLQKVNCGSKANLHDKKNLNELLLYWGLTEIETTTDEAATQERVLESLVPHDELKILGLNGYGGRTVSHWMRKSEMFRSLKELIMSDCNRCKDLPTIWLLPSLELLSLRFMESLTTLCKNVDVEAKACSTSLQMFPKLKRMELRCLNGLETWAENSTGEMNSSVLFPELKELTIIDCDKLTTLPGNPVLTDLEIYHCTSLLEIPQLPASLEKAWISDCRSLVALSSNLGNLFKLRDLRISCCRGLKGLPDGMDGLTSLERLRIDECEGIEEFPQGLFQRLPTLRHLTVQHCGLKTLPDGMEGLTSLEMLKIGGCPGIEEFPQGLLQRLPSLKHLYIRGCPGLQRRCREGGEYFDLVSSIPFKSISAAAEPQTGEGEEPVKRSLSPFISFNR